jgi:hypothetical protein
MRGETATSGSIRGTYTARQLLDALRSDPQPPDVAIEQRLSAVNNHYHAYVSNLIGRSRVRHVPPRRGRVQEVPDQDQPAITAWLALRLPRTTPDLVAAPPQ